MKSSNLKSRETGVVVNTRRVAVIIERANGSRFSLEPKKSISGVCREDFRPLPSGVEFIAE